MNLLLVLKYIREITIAVLTIAVIALIGLYGQSRADIEQLKTEHALELTTLRADYQTRARKLEQANYEQVITAINDHKARQADDARAIASANTANERLSQTIDRLAANAATDAAYRIEYATTTGELLKDCSGSITKLAAAADGHVNDIKLLQDARRGVQ
jgi:lipopolysaccharide export LptBFGC system permease protein LptF